MRAAATGRRRCRAGGPGRAAAQGAGCSAVIVGPVGSARAQVSPASIALLVQQRVPGLEVILTATTWEKSLMVLQADLLGHVRVRHSPRAVPHRARPPLHGDYPNAAGVWEVDSLGLIEVLRGLNEGATTTGFRLADRPRSSSAPASIRPRSDFAA